MGRLRRHLVVMMMVASGWTGARIDAAAQAIDLQQGWTKSQSEDFWFRSQGSRIMLFSWFIGLEQPGNQDLLSDRAYLERLGFIGIGNRPLPIGFAQDTNASKTATYVGLTCAACHTSRLTIEGQRVIVEGGAALVDFSGFLDALVASTTATLGDEAKFKRFGARLKITTPSELAVLKGQLATVSNELSRRRAQNAPQVPYGHGRVDAFGHIFNRVFATALGVESNAAVPDAPVSYPFLWDTPHHDHVQWNASAPNAFGGDIGRNVGELLGVFGYLDLTDFSVLGYRKSSVRVEKLVLLESLVKKLRSPVWPENVLPLKAALVARGQTVYANNCIACHKLIDRTDPFRKANEQAVDARTVGTDRTMTDNHARRLYADRLKSGLLKGRPRLFSLQIFGDETSGDEILKHVLAGVIAGQTLPSDRGLSPREIPAPPPTSDAASMKTVYKARPLNGVWATAPYLHNGSVPTLRDMLSDTRPSTFWVGSTTFDANNVGLSTAQAPNASLFDTTKGGNSNAGHAYGVNLPSEDKDALLEYLKQLH